MKKIVILSMGMLCLLIIPANVHAFSLNTSNGDAKNVQQIILSPNDQKKLDSGVQNLKLTLPDGKEVAPKTEQTSGSSSHSISVGIKTPANTGNVDTDTVVLPGTKGNIINIGPSNTIGSGKDNNSYAAPKVNYNIPQNYSNQGYTPPPVEDKKPVQPEEKKEIVPEIKQIPDTQKVEEKKMQDAGNASEEKPQGGDQVVPQKPQNTILKKVSTEKALKQPVVKADIAPKRIEIQKQTLKPEEVKMKTSVSPVQTKKVTVPTPVKKDVVKNTAKAVVVKKSSAGSTKPVKK